MADNAQRAGPNAEQYRMEKARYRAQIRNFTYLVDTKQHPKRSHRAFLALQDQIARVIGHPSSTANQPNPPSQISTLKSEIDEVQA